MAQRSKRVSLKPIVKEIRKMQSAVRSLRGGATATQRSQLNLDLKRLTKLERSAKQICRAFFLRLDK